MPLLTALFVLLMHPAFAHPVHHGNSAHPLHPLHAAHTRHHTQPLLHHTTLVTVHTLRTHAKQARVHKTVSSQAQRGPAGQHHSTHAVLRSRPHAHLVRQASPRTPLASHLAPNAPPMAFGATVTSALLSSLTTYRLSVGHLRPSLGRAPPVLL